MASRGLFLCLLFMQALAMLAQAKTCKYNPKTEVLLVVDVSAKANKLSGNNFKDLKTALPFFLGLLKGRNAGIRSGLISYSDTAKMVVDPQADNSLKATINAVAQIPNGVAEAGSNLNAALGQIKSQAGASGKKYVIIITLGIFTDQAQIKPMETEAKRLKDAGYTIIPIYIPDPNATPKTPNGLAALKRIASHGYFHKTFGYFSVNELLAQMEKNCLAGNGGNNGGPATAPMFSGPNFALRLSCFAAFTLMLNHMVRKVWMQ